jgi:photosystem II stability/assembly factor-like uncharacterized protein
MKHLTTLIAMLFIGASISAQEISPSLYQQMRWRMIGPFRAGRTVAASGVPGAPNIFYIAANNGGVWKSTDYGRVWSPIFDDQPTGSIGALAVAPSNPNVVYVGSGEGLQRPDLSTGDGIYKSTDAGKTWRHLGLRNGEQIGSIIIDPRDEKRLFVAVLGHPYGANEERGVFRSIDGGETFQNVLYRDENTGAIGLAFDPLNSQTVYATLWASRQGPWENGAWQGAGSGLFKSVDGGTTWRQLTRGLPTIEQGLGRIGIAVAPSDSNRIYLTVDAPQLGGIYRSDDAGESFERISDDARLWGRGSDFAEIKVHPKNPDFTYVANIAAYRSEDGGHTYKAFRGAPGGDDYHTIWINPENPDIILLAADQGAIITVNGGATWSSWYNQPTAQFYHVITDNQFPYWVYGGQQESGSVGTSSRGDNGVITFREWRTVGAEEYGYVAPDPLNPDFIYGGKITRFDKRTGQVQNVAPEIMRSGKYRFLRTAPVLFSPKDPHVLYLGAQVVLKTTNGGNSWEVISPDLTREAPQVPESIGIFRTPELARQPRRGVIYTIAPSYQDVNVIWAGTDDGLIHVTRDGGKDWKDVTPKDLTAWSKVSIMDAGRFDRATAYAAINRIRLDDQRPHIYRTHDFGATWQEITSGLPANAPVNVVREDPLRRGLLFAGTEREVFVSLDDGDHWLPLRLNMPAISVRDLVVHNDDLIAGTHGRGFWILDDITPLRQISGKTSSADAFLFEPQTAYRYRRNVNTDTPLPQEEPAGENPPDGAIIDYYLRQKPAGDVTLEIFDHDNRLVRRFSSSDKPEAVNEIELAIPTYWIRPPRILGAEAGMHRFVWDLHYPAPEGLPRTYPISASFGDTPSTPMGPLALPGIYSVKLSAGGLTYEQRLKLEMDPRVKSPRSAWEQQFALAKRTYDSMIQTEQAIEAIREVRAQIRALGDRAAANPAIAAFDQKAAAIEGRSERIPRGGAVAGAGEPTLTRMLAELSQLLAAVDGADEAPTMAMNAASTNSSSSLAALLARWKELTTVDLKALNGQLTSAGLPQVIVK